MANGSRHSMRITAESIQGTTPATPAFDIVRHTGTTLGLSKESLQSEELRDDRQISDFRHGAYQVGGDINFELSFGSFDKLLEAVLLGTWAEDSPAVGIDRLTAGTVRRSFTIERFFGDILTADKPYHRFTGVEFNTFALAVNANAMITGTFGVLGQNMVTASDKVAGATYNQASTTSPLDSFTGSLSEAGSPIAVVTEVSLSLANSLEARFVVGSKQSIRPSVGRSNVTGSVTAYFENSTLLDKFINETESSLSFTLPDGAGNEYTFTLPRIKYTGGQPDIEGEGPITLSMPFQALLDPVTGTNIIIDRKAAAVGP